MTNTTTAYDLKPVHKFSPGALYCSGRSTGTAKVASCDEDVTCKACRRKMAKQASIIAYRVEGAAELEAMGFEAVFCACGNGPFIKDASFAPRCSDCRYADDRAIGMYNPANSID